MELDKIIEEKVKIQKEISKNNDYDLDKMIQDAHNTSKILEKKYGKLKYRTDIPKK